MREILFRGQTRRYGEKVRMNGEKVKSNWVYGGIFPNNRGGDFSIIYQQEPTIEKFTVYSDTVGQYTGLTDNNGKRIFEGDIVNFKTGYYQFENLIISFDEQTARFVCENKKSGKMPLDSKWSYKVIGNIHDNPELLEAKE